MFFKLLTQKTSSVLKIIWLGVFIPTFIPFEARAQVEPFLGPTFSIDRDSPTIGEPAVLQDFEPISAFDVLKPNVFIFSGSSGGIDIGGPGPGIDVSDQIVLSPDFEIDALSSGFHDPFVNTPLFFSVDRESVGLEGGIGPNVFTEAPLFQQAGDIYLSNSVFLAPALAAASLPGVGPGFAGPLPTDLENGTHTLSFNQNALIDGFSFNLVPTIAPGVFNSFNPVGSPVPLQDNIDGFEFDFFDSPDPDNLPDQNLFYSFDLATADQFGVSPADVLVEIPDSVNPPIYPSGNVFASASTLGLDLFGAGTDDLDALVIFDGGDVGELNPLQDFALFSLAPGSASLENSFEPLSAADVFVTAFDGRFGYLPELSLAPGRVSNAQTLGLQTTDNIDALEVENVPPDVPLPDAPPDVPPPDAPPDVPPPDVPPPNGTPPVNGTPPDTRIPENSSPGALGMIAFIIVGFTAFRSGRKDS